MFRWLFKKLSHVWRWINPTANTAQAIFVRLVAGDLIRSYLTRNPKTKMLLTDIDGLVYQLRKIVYIKETTAERIIRSVIHELGLMAG